jgi:RNA polymerase sigma-70 factor (ECF subfamily)
VSLPRGGNARGALAQSHEDLLPETTNTVDLETTAVLLDRARRGEEGARERLVRRYLPYLRAFARGRLPSGARSLEETDDIVQVAMIRGLAQIERFRGERGGSFLVYLRVILDNLIRDRWRSEARRPKRVELSEEFSDGASSPLDGVVEREDREAYEEALARIKPRQREAIILRFELDLSYEAIAEELGVSSAAAARMRVERGLLRLAQLLEKRSSKP